MRDNGEIFEELGGYTDFAPGSECHITFYLLGPAATSAFGANAAAHELFHCVQRASLTQDQIHTSNGGAPGGGTWWIEGSAEWFTTLALGAPAYQRSRVELFDSNSPTTALNDMAYEAYVFFAWLGGAHGPNAVVPFLQQMAASASPGAQRAAMGAAMPQSDWLHFAEDYMDRNIRDGQGVSIGSSPQEGGTLEWNETRTERLTLAPFTLSRRNLSVHCGRWSFAPRPSQYHAAKPASGSWGELPRDLDNLANDHGDFRFVAMNTSASDVALQLAVTRTAECAECGGSHELDRCMIGTWQMTTDGAEQWMREHLRGYHSTGLSAVGNTMTLRADGTFTTGSSHTEASGTLGSASGRGFLNAQGSGRWSTSGGNLNICTDAASAAGQVTVIEHGHSVTVRTAPQIPPVSSNGYACSGDTFTQTIPMGSHGEVRSTYNRISR
ncbi:MAG: hypothetical protein JSS00_05140 [Proteobacteria bacterium]|nr:hypothetical protein [Pseudomonadota bacterium]